MTPGYRKANATIVRNGKEMYPIGSKKDAEDAWGLRNNAKPPLSSSEMQTLRAKVESYGVKTI
jgi:hypothetical protein